MPANLVTPPASEPVTLDEAKDHLHVDGTDEDTYITTLITVARQQAERVEGRVYITQTWALTLDEFPDGDWITLPVCPLLTVEEVTYLDADGTEQTWASSNYVVDTKSTPGRLALAPDKEWPTTQSGRVNAVTITMSAGYGAASAVPKTAKQAVLLLIGHWFANREPVLIGSISKRLEDTADALLMTDRVRTEF